MISISLPSRLHWFPRRLFLQARLHFIIFVFVLFTFDSINSPFICWDKNWRIFFCYLGCCPLTKIKICLKTVWKTIYDCTNISFIILWLTTQWVTGKLAEIGFVPPPIPEIWPPPPSVFQTHIQINLVQHAHHYDWKLITMLKYTFAWKKYIICMYLL